jgi:hypothetical protein
MTELQSASSILLAARGLNPQEKQFEGGGRTTGADIIKPQPLVARGGRTLTAAQI